MKYLKLKHLIIIVAILGFFVLLFFPEPQTNFLAYLITALFFVVVIVIMVKLKNK